MTGRTVGLVAAALLIVAVCCGTSWLAASNPDSHPPTGPSGWITPASPTNP